ncbi:MAG TPA: hypothetical protein VLL98_06240 [Rickettsiales bacterium]|nr:hypothetical protein [Rickettsiales bacterium]
MLNEFFLEKFEKIKPEAEKFYNQRKEITNDFNFDATPSTYRVFRSTKQKPSIVFKTWAFNTIGNIGLFAVIGANEFFIDILSINDKKSFNEFHKKYSNALSDFWIKEQKEALELTYKYKLFDLFLKSLTICNFNNENINKQLLKYCNIPLDSITLNGLDKITDGKLNLAGKSMGFVKTEETYNELQNIVLDICKRTNNYPLYFDFFSKII